MQYNYKPYILKVVGREPQSMNELAHCVIDVISRDVKVVGFAWNLIFGTVANTHSCPIGGTISPSFYTNRDYKGWKGRVWIRYSDEIKKYTFASHTFRKTITHTGTGGIGGYNGPWDKFLHDQYITKRAYRDLNCYGWDYRIYDLDWPEIKEVTEYNELLTYSKLKDELVTSLHHKFEWTDPDIQESDDKIYLRNKHG